MSNNKFPIKNKYDIHDRIFEYIVQVIQATKKLKRTPENLVITNQVLRSVTSVGANDQEADGSSSKKDFLHCYALVRKEGKETLFWLKLTQRINPQFSLDKLIAEGNEIVAIISTIIKNTNK